MKKILIVLTLLISLFILSIGTLLFTSVGNTLIASYLESYVNKQSSLGLKVNELELSLNKIKFKAVLDKNSNITINGFFDIFNQTVNLKYLVDIVDLSKLETFTRTKLKGSLTLTGSFKGDEKEAKVIGQSNIFDSKTHYDINLENFEPKTAKIVVSNAKLEQALLLSNQNSYATGIVNINADIKSFKHNNLDGSINVNFKDVLLNNVSINQDFDLNLSKKVILQGHIDSILSKSKIVSKSNINSSLADITINHNIIDLDKKSLQSDYLLQVTSLKNLSDFIQIDSNLGFNLKGIVNAKNEDIRILGKTNLFQGLSHYDVKIKNKKLEEIQLDSSSLDVGEILGFAQQPQYLRGKINLLAKIKNANLGLLDGTIDFDMKEVLLKNDVLKKHHLLDLKNDIVLDVTVKSTLNKNNVISNLDISSVPINIKANNVNINLEDKSINTNYDMFIKDLFRFERVANTKLRGSVSVKGDIKGNEKALQIKGSSNIFSSQTTFVVGLNNKLLSQVDLNSKNIKFEKLLNTLHLPLYANGLININTKLLSDNLKPLKGKINTELKNIILNNKVLNKLYTLKLKTPNSIKGTAVTFLDNNIAQSGINITSNMAKLSSKKSKYDLTTGSFNSDYEISTPDLNSLYELTNTKLRGAFLLKGVISKNKKLKITGASTLLGGTLDFTLLENDLEAMVQNIQTKELLTMMYYPVVFDSKAKSEIKYNLKSKQGEVDTLLENGKILPNKYTNTVKNFTKFDLTREAYTSSTLKSKINKNIITSILDMNSKNTEIDVPSSKIDLEKRSITALVETRLDDILFDTKVSGSLDQPKIKIQTDKLIESTVKTKVFKKLEEKYLNKSEGDAVKSLLKSLFK